MNYFNKFPLISYNGQTAVNLLARAGIPPKVRNNKTVFYDYVTTEEDRVDTLAQDYYDNPGFSWLVWHANDIIDPYYDMSITDSDLFKLIESKYGSIEEAQRKTAFYRVNWYGDLNRITIADFNDLPVRYKKYWVPYLDQYGSIAGYQRDRAELTINTNRVVSLAHTLTTGVSFTVGEKVYVSSSTYGYCTYSDSTITTIQHIRGDFESSDIVGLSITGEESGTVGTLISSTVIASTDAWTDAIYWEPVSFFDYEMELNEKKKNIKLINNMYAVQVENELRRVLKQT